MVYKRNEPVLCIPARGHILQNWGTLARFQKVSYSDLNQSRDNTCLQKGCLLLKAGELSKSVPQDFSGRQVLATLFLQDHTFALVAYGVGLAAMAVPAGSLSARHKSLNSNPLDAVEIEATKGLLLGRLLLSQASIALGRRLSRASAGGYMPGGHGHFCFFLVDGLGARRRRVAPSRKLHARSIVVLNVINTYDSKDCCSRAALVCRQFSIRAVQL